MEEDAYGMGRRGKERRMKRDPVPNDTNTHNTRVSTTYIELLLSIWSPSLFANVGAVIPECPWDGSLSVITPSLIVEDAAHHDQVQHQDQDKDKGQDQDQHRYSAPAGGLAGEGAVRAGGRRRRRRRRMLRNAELTCWYVLVAGTARGGSTFRYYTALQPYTGGSSTVAYTLRIVHHHVPASRRRTRASRQRPQRPTVKHARQPRSQAKRLQVVIPIRSSCRTGK